MVHLCIIIRVHVDVGRHAANFLWSVGILFSFSKYLRYIVSELLSKWTFREFLKRGCHKKTRHTLIESLMMAIESKFWIGIQTVKVSFFCSTGFKANHLGRVIKRVIFKDFVNVWPLFILYPSLNSKPAVASFELFHELSMLPIHHYEKGLFDGLLKTT